MINLLYIDLFCGAGGVSEGISRNKSAKVIAAVNHDEMAIKSHSKNHPDTFHFKEDIRTLNLDRLKRIVKKERLKHPSAKVVLWASLECTHFSNAKGGQKLNNDSRTLAEHLYRYIDEINPDYIQIENVREFMTWGALLPNGRPDPNDRGRLFIKWVDEIKDRGYSYDYRLINSADLGAYTARTRYFATFAKRGLPVAWPELNKEGKPVKHVLDLDDVGQDIFKRKRPLVDRTLQRIYNGLMKSLEEYQLMSYYGNGRCHSINDPCPTVTTRDRFALIHLNWLINPQYKNNGRSVERPCFTLIARMDKAPPSLLTSKIKLGQKVIIKEMPGANYEEKLKALMKANGIESIHLRMLNINELKRIMGFSDSYILKGTQADQKRFIGNAVECTTSHAISEALSNIVRSIKKIA